jgi:hypothetical protein
MVSGILLSFLILPDLGAPCVVGTSAHAHRSKKLAYIFSDLTLNSPQIHVKPPNHSFSSSSTLTLILTISTGIFICDRLGIGFIVSGTTIFDTNLSSYVVYQRSAIQD